jgi:hypothetical protein
MSKEIAVLIPANTVIKFNGVPFRLPHDTYAMGSPEGIAHAFGDEPKKCSKKCDSGKPIEVTVPSFDDLTARLVAIQVPPEGAPFSFGAPPAKEVNDTETLTYPATKSTAPFQPVRNAIRKRIIAQAAQAIQQRLSTAENTDTLAEDALSFVESERPLMTLLLSIDWAKLIELIVSIAVALSLAKKQG